jgi:hypothetical protein
MDFAEVLSALMAERGIGICALARRVPCDKGLISKIASGRQRPSQRIAGRLDEILAADGRLADLAIARACSSGDDGDVDRRAFLGLGLGSSAVLAVQAERLRLRVDAALDASATSVDVTEWEHAAWDYASKVGYMPPEQIISDILVDLNEVNSRLTDCPDSLRSRLVRVCSQFTALAAVVFHQLGDPASARRYWRTAVRAADQSGDIDLRSLLRSRRAVWALYDQCPMTAVLELADDAIAVAGGRACAGVADGYAARSRALAHLGRHDEAHQAFAELCGVFTRLPTSTTADRVSQWGWSEKRLRCVQSEVYSLAGSQRQAFDAQDAMPALCPPSAYQSPAQVELHRATCLIVKGDPGEGARHVVRILRALPDAHRRDFIVRHTGSLALSRVPDRARQMPDVLAARELLAVSAGKS